MPLQYDWPVKPHRTRPRPPARTNIRTVFVFVVSFPLWRCTKTRKVARGPTSDRCVVSYRCSRNSISPAPPSRQPSAYMAHTRPFFKNYNEEPGAVGRLTDGVAAPRSYYHHDHRPIRLPSVSILEMPMRVTTRSASNEEHQTSDGDETGGMADNTKRLAS